MDKFKERFYKILIDKENFFIQQYYSNFHKKEMYIAIKDLKDGIYCVLISGEESEKIDAIEAMEYIRSLEKPFSFNAVIFSDNEYKNNNDQLMYKLVINKNNNNVILCDNSCLPLKNIFENHWKSNKEKNESIKKYFKYKVITLIIIGINMVMFLFTAVLSGSIFDISSRVLLKYGGKVNVLIENGEVWRLLTSAFLHAGLIHITANMYSLYIIGPEIEQIYGSVRYLLVYLFSCITASLLSYYMNPHSLSVGASGGIFGLMGALIVFSIIERKRLNKKYLSSLLQVVAVNLFIGFSIIGIDNYAHIGGLIGGALMGCVTYKRQRE